MSLQRTQRSPEKLPQMDADKRRYEEMQTLLCLFKVDAFLSRLCDSAPLRFIIPSPGFRRR